MYTDQGFEPHLQYWGNFLTKESAEARLISTDFNISGHSLDHSFLTVSPRTVVLQEIRAIFNGVILNGFQGIQKSEMSNTDAQTGLSSAT